MIACVMSIGVIGQFEAIQVDEEHRDLAFVALGSAYFHVQMFPEPPSLGQTSEFIVRCLVLYLPLLLGDPFILFNQLCGIFCKARR
jgi:hypothetical protein